MKEIEVVRKSELKGGDSTQGMMRENAFEGEGVLFAMSRIAGGAISGWHHHGVREGYGFLVSGKLRIESGERRNAVEMKPGDFFHIPVGLVHRDANPDGHQEAVVVNIFLGEGPTVVNVSAP